MFELCLVAVYYDDIDFGLGFAVGQEAALATNGGEISLFCKSRYVIWLCMMTLALVWVFAVGLDGPRSTALTTVSLNGGEMADARCGLHQPDSFVALPLNLRISFNSISRSRF